MKGYVFKKVKEIPRKERIIKEKKEKEGIGGNLSLFKTHRF
jgi:hypothetical protein